MTGCRRKISGEEFEQRRFSRAVPADDADTLSLANPEGNVDERRHATRSKRRVGHAVPDQRAQVANGLPGMPKNGVVLADPLDVDSCSIAHSKSIIAIRARLNTHMPNRNMAMTMQVEPQMAMRKYLGTMASS